MKKGFLHWLLIVLPIMISVGTASFVPTLADIIIGAIAGLMSYMSYMFYELN